MLCKLIIFALVVAGPVRAADWLDAAVGDAARAAVVGAPAPEASKPDWVPYEPASRLFRADLPPVGWRAFEEEDALGPIVRVLGPDDASGAFRSTLTVRLIDRDSPIFIPAKDAVDAMRRQGPNRESSAVRPLRVGAGLARIFEISETRRLPVDFGPSTPLETHQYVAVIPRGDAYFVVRLITARENYLDFRDDFVRFLKALKPVGGR